MSSMPQFRNSIFLTLAIALFGSICLPLRLDAAEKPPAPQPSDQPRKVDFSREVLPIFAKRCFACHGPDQAKAGLRLDQHERLLAKLDSGEHAVVPGKIEESALLLRIGSTDEAERMPPEGKPLTDAEIALIRSWIAEGAHWERHWAFAAPVRHEPPVVENGAWVRNPIDAFILERLEKRGLAPAPPADEISLLRRAYYDLTGLPPTPGEVDAFLADTSSDAYGSLIDRLLDSPRYGERWARHWLDVVRYADTNSFERDGLKPHAWRYRDYVIRAFNDDKPYDQFVREQLAGDELPHVTRDSIIATGYYRLGLWDDEPADRLQAKFDVLDDIVATTGQVFLGLTVNCARCHDHKIDPVPQRDYYGLLAFFHGISPHAKSGPNIEVPLFENDEARARYQEQVRALEEKRNRIQAEIQSLEEELRKRYAESFSESGGEQIGQTDLDDLEYRFYRDHWDRLPDFDNIKPETIAKLPRQLFDIRPATRKTEFGFVFTGFLKVPREGDYEFRLDSDDGSRLLIDGKPVVTYDGIHGTGQPQNGRVRLAQGRVPIRLEYFQRSQGLGLSVSWSGPGFENRSLSATAEPRLGIAELMQQHGAKLLGEERSQKLKSLQSLLEQSKKETVPIDTALAVTETGSQPPETFVLLRGNAHVPGEKVNPSFPQILDNRSPKMSSLPPEARTAGRRLALAEWIASPDNILTARVIVNRVWQHHFGRGIVRSPNNFGMLGDRPTHPELLDWLASEFVKQGWRLKALHRLIMTSNVYRMSSHSDAAALVQDPSNDLFWRFDMRRLSAEEIRDSIHAVSGQLNLKMYGPGVFPEISASVLAGQSNPGDGWGKSSPEEQARRSIYIHVKRSLITPILADFDFADTDSSCAARFVTTQPTQALAMLNGEFLHRQSVEFANRLRREAPGSAESQVRLALRLALVREPDTESVKQGLQLMDRLRNRHGLSADVALNFYCLTVLNLNEFAYLD